ncbi:OLC1v1006140C1 [Oldenlandia corymbosa var. corymbosa]|uniref:OLC1v1006140C1 n=1 Tax=Oldenlandia corymbosa var. corymbosa TaxID=529605 RepID=A0AAV1DID8_OLDCO|nr:OLC1v1006140C1 [Oldenlandia corymbosa var. corymbosa]
MEDSRKQLELEEAGIAGLPNAMLDVDHDCAKKDQFVKKRYKAFLYEQHLKEEEKKKKKKKFCKPNKSDEKDDDDDDEEFEDALKVDEANNKVDAGKQIDFVKVKKPVPEDSTAGIYCLLDLDVSCATLSMP